MRSVATPSRTLISKVEYRYAMISCFPFGIHVPKTPGIIDQSGREASRKSAVSAMGFHAGSGGYVSLDSSGAI
jgi:hypothetical protein